MIATSLAIILGYFLTWRLTIYPGISSISYIIPAFTISYGIALCAILFLRIDYSRFFFLFSFATTQVWFHIIIYLANRKNKLNFDVVPLGNANRLCDITDASWNILRGPKLPGVPTNGVAVDLRADLSNEWESFIADTAVGGVPVYHYKQLSENLTGRVEMEHLSENNLGSLLPNYLYLRFKYALDIAGVILALPILLPIFILIAIAIKKDGKGPVFFRQERMGYQGRVFTVWKFRTMEVSTSSNVSEREASITVNNDKRITKVGEFLRRSRLDELPQIINIVRGEMSWIGPRPEAKALSYWYQEKIPFYRYRHIVRPGISGWAQVNQGHVADVDDVRSKLQYDFYYIKYFSIWLDILITLRTINTMLTGFGAR